VFVLAVAFVAALALATFAASLEIVQSVRRRATPLSLPVAFATLVFYEALALPALSAATWLNAAGVVAAQLPLIALGALVVRRRRAAGRHHRLPRLPRWALLPIAPVALLLVTSAVEYPPNTWDAMTYHLARVAHWISNESVLAYPSWSDRQNQFPPGAAYLLLVPQVVTGSDRLAAFVQFGCWALLVTAAPSWARLLGAPKRVAPLAAIFVATAPMAVLQATSTQYDLVASVAALGVAGASVSLVGRRRPALRECALLGVTLSAAWLVKTTAVVAALPFLAWAAVAQLRRIRTDGFTRVLSSLATALAPLALAFAVESLRRGAVALSLESEASLYVYTGGAWLDRLANSARGLAHHLPISAALRHLSPALAPASGEGVGLGPELFRPHEDYVGNPLQAALFLAACAAVIGRRRKVPRRTLAAIACTTTAWVVMHALARDNAWISRLEMPIFVLGASAVGSFGALRGRIARGSAVAWASLAVAYGACVAVRNETRPPRLSMPDPVVARYVNLPEFRALDDAALAVAKELRCTRIGVRLTPPPGLDDPWDYPLIWRARAEGIEVRHVDGREPWPCVLESMTRPPGAWVWSGSGVAYVRPGSR
jgi:hypothetical protein